MSHKIIPKNRVFDLVYGKIQRKWDMKLEKRRLERRHKISSSRILKRSERDDDSMFVAYNQYQ